MKKLKAFKSALIGGASLFAMAAPAAGKVFDIPRGDLAAALDAFSDQAGVQLIYSDEQVRGHHTNGAKGSLTETAALTQLLSGSGFTVQMLPSNTIGIVPAPRELKPHAETIRVAAAVPRAPMPGAVETVVVTAQHKSENIQNVPIAVTALSQAQLTERQIAGGPDLLREVPNMNFSKTNFSGYSIELRGIGTQAISVTTDPAVAVAFNGIPFIRNHFFEQEFYDLADAEVLRGPQGTLWGRNATAGVVNLKSALPDDSYEAMASADIGNFSNRRLEGMLNVPIVSDKLDLRIAGEWTKRDGYSFNEITNQPIDGRDLWSGRISIGFKPTENLDADFVWEHFSEDDDRLRSGKQLCETAPIPSTVGGYPTETGAGADAFFAPYYLSQGCQATSLYASTAFQVPNGLVLPYATPISQVVANVHGYLDPYASTTQSTNLRVIESAINPTYRAKNDTLELNADYRISPALTFTSQTGYNNDFLWSSEDYNRFNTVPGYFEYIPASQRPDEYQTGTTLPDPSGMGRCQVNLGAIDNQPGACFGKTLTEPCSPATSDGSTDCRLDGIFCDPQVGCSGRLVAEDLNDEHAWQFSQEFRLSSNFSGPFNFSFGGNFLHYETEENYYVFINSLTLYTTYDFSPYPYPPSSWVPGVSDNSNCMRTGYAYPNPLQPQSPVAQNCSYIDPNPLTSLNNEGHNYFLSQNPYVLSSYAGFGEAYYNITNALKLTGGLRWTDDQKHFIDIPSELLVPGYGYPVTGIVDQQWNEWTGRSAVDWTPKLDFTDQTLVYASYGHGYKAGGANPPGATLLTYGDDVVGTPIHPLTFKPEHIEAFELGTKNTLLDGTLTLNGDVFYYNYHGYQISRIVDRTAINDNFNAHIEGAELESTWEPLPGLKFNFAGGYEDSIVGKGQSSIDLMDRAAGNPNWIVVRPFVTKASNCILPTYVVGAILSGNANVYDACNEAYGLHLDPATGQPYLQNPCSQEPCGPGTGIFVPPGYPGFDPLSVDPNAPANVNNGLGLPPNNGEGFAKNLSGHALPNAPPFTASFTAEYTIPVSDSWAATLHGDFYWQADSWARIFNDNPYDRLRGYTNLNLSLILTSANGWQVMGYVKNVFDTTAITGDFLNSDDSGLTTNVFLTDPRLFGVRVTKQLDQNDGFWGSDYSGYEFFTGLFSDADNSKPPLWIEVGGNFDQLADGHKLFSPPFLPSLPAKWGSQLTPQKAPSTGLDWESKVSYEPDDSDWVFSASARYGRASQNRHTHRQTQFTFTPTFEGYTFGKRYSTPYVETKASDSESHAILDFMAGKNAGLGSLGPNGTSTLSGGIRYAAFSSQSGMNIFANPKSEFHPTSGPKYDFHNYSGSFNAKRSFHGIGPTLAWDASTSMSGDRPDGEISLDWGANAAVLFGRQRAMGTHKTGGAYYCSNSEGRKFLGIPTVPCPIPTPNAQNPDRAPIKMISRYQRTHSFTRSRMVTVPNIGAFVGVSYKLPNAKLSFGYRADEFFGAMDGGIDTRKSENVGFFGPYANISIGLGG